jgi:hypothetical protein
MRASSWRITFVQLFDHPRAATYGPLSTDEETAALLEEA